MDLRNEFPPKQEGKTLCKGSFSAFGLSLQGASHADKEVPVPCQDYNDFRYLEKEDLFIAAIADGVGSCELSHWGAYTAVCAVLDSVERSVKEKNYPGKLILDGSMGPEMKEIMLNAFRTAQDAVERKADEGTVLPALCLSTLTLAIYDGENLYYGHVGDDGIVAQTEDGSVEMLTSRIKGEEASSVYPLQSSEKMWRFGRSASKIAGFIMATDGVLDAFVTNRADYFGVNYNKGVYYPFMKDAMYILSEGEQAASEKAVEQYKQFMLSENYRKAVTDDLTLVAVVSNKLMNKAVRPKFNVKIWETIAEESANARKLALRRKPIPLAGLEAIQPSGSDAVQEGVEQEILRQEEKNTHSQSNVKEFDGGAEESKQTLQCAEAANSDPLNQNNAAKKKGIALLAGTAIAAVIIGVLVGRSFFPAVSKAEHGELVESYRTLEQNYGALVKDYEALKESYRVLEKKYDTLLDEKDDLAEDLADSQQKNEVWEVKHDKTLLEIEEQNTELQVLKEAYGITDEDIQNMIAESEIVAAATAKAESAQNKADIASKAADAAEAAAMEASAAADAQTAAKAVEKAKAAQIQAASAATEAEQAAAEAKIAAGDTEKAAEFVDLAAEAAKAAREAEQRAKDAVNSAMEAAKKLESKQ